MATALAFVSACSNADELPPSQEASDAQSASAGSLPVATDEIACTDAELVDPVEETSSGDEQPSELVDGLHCLIAFEDGVASYTYFELGDGSSMSITQVRAWGGEITDIEPTRDMVAMLFETIDLVDAPDLEKLLPPELVELDDEGNSHHVQFKQDGLAYTVSVSRNDEKDIQGFRIDTISLDPEPAWQNHHALPFSLDQVAFDGKGELSSDKLWCSPADDPGNDTVRCNGAESSWGYARMTISLEADRVVTLSVRSKSDNGGPGVDEVAEQAAGLMEGPLADLVTAAGAEAAEADSGKIVIVNDIPVWVSGEANGWRTFVAGTVIQDT